MRTAKVCRHCEMLVTTVPQFVRDYYPQQVAVWHAEARCCEALEPIGVVDELAAVAV